MMLLTAGAAAASALGGCAGASEGEGASAGPIEQVPLRTSTRSFNRLPARVPGVRTVHYAPFRTNEILSTKALPTPRG